MAYAVEKFLYKKSKLIIVLTPAFYNIFRYKKNISISKLIMIPNAADFSLSEDILTTFFRDLFRKQHSL